MTEPTRKAAITGASGYLGSLLCQRLKTADYEIVPFVRTTRGDPNARQFELGNEVAPDLLEDIDLLVHCAYDLRIVNEREIWQTNVGGTERLLGAANKAQVRRVIVLSSMSAYEGTTQIYGRAKLAIERATMTTRGVIVRPGLTWGDLPGGMAGSLRRLARLPIVPVVGGSARQYLVHEADFAEAIAVLANVEEPPEIPLSVTYPIPVAFRQILESFAKKDNRRPILFSIPWQAVSIPLRLAEQLHIPLPFRSDSLLGLVHRAPDLSGTAELAGLQLNFRPFI